MGRIIKCFLVTMAIIGNLFIANKQAFAAPLMDYSAGTVAIDLGVRYTSGNMDLGFADVNFDKKYSPEIGVTVGVGNNLAVQVYGMNTKSDSPGSTASAAGLSESKLENRQINLLYKLNKNVSAYTGVVRNKYSVVAAGQYVEEKMNDKLQIGVIYSKEFERKIKAYASLGAADNYIDWKIGISKDISPNMEVNLDYRSIKITDSNMLLLSPDVYSKGLGIGITYKF